MIRIVMILVLVAVAGACHAAEAPTMLDYFKTRLPAATPPAETDTMPIMQGNGSAIRMIDPAYLAPKILTIRQGATEPDDTPKIRVFDKTGKLRLTITADGAVVLE